MKTAATPSLPSALDDLWNRFLTDTLERVAVLESAAAAVASGSLTDTLRLEAKSAAHKLAGALGTFGLAEGTAIARQLEALYDRDSGPPKAVSSLLSQAASELRAIVQNRGSGPV
jgi:HPt (histidine-containing phosphotransfer) domain-containing protein